jgi:tRNA threonylcarbamoyl adenosine modification protein YjeE
MINRQGTNSGRKGPAAMVAALMVAASASRALAAEGQGASANPALLVIICVLLPALLIALGAALRSRRRAHQLAEQLQDEWRLRHAVIPLVATVDAEGRIKRLTGADSLGLTPVEDGQPASFLTVALLAGDSLSGPPPWTMHLTQGGQERYLLGWPAQEAPETMSATRRICLSPASTLLGAMNELQETRGQLDQATAMLDTLPLPLWRRDASLGLAWVNRAFVDFVEGSNKASVLEDQRELAASPAFGTPRRLAEKARESHVLETHSLPVIVKGERRQIALNEMPIQAAPAGTSGYLGWALDESAAAALAREFERHRQAQAEILEAMGAAIAIFGQDTRLTFYNSNFARLWRLEERWLDGSPSYAELLDSLRARGAIPETENFRDFRSRQLARFTALPATEEEVLHLPDGRTLRVVIAAHPPGGLLFSYEDVTNALELQASYDTLMAVQRETLDNLAEGVAVFSSDGRLTLLNPAFMRLFQLSPPETARGPHAAELVDRMLGVFPHPDADLRRELLSLALERSSRSLRAELNQGLVVEISSVPLPDGAMLNTVVDITDTVQVERSLRADNAALTEVGRIKSEFLANVTSQLRSPINAVQGYADILQRGQFGELTQRQNDQVDGILEASEKLRRLIDDILDLATIEAGMLSLDLALVPVATLLSEAGEITRDWARRSDVALMIDCAGDAGLILGDRRRLVQVLFRLVSNAIRATPAGGRVLLSARRGPEGLEITVSDTGLGGPGIEPGLLFTPFDRAARGRDGEGPALGLTLARNIIELHGGNLTLGAQPGGGTRVCLTLPATQPLPLMPDALEDFAMSARNSTRGLLLELPDPAATDRLGEALGPLLEPGDSVLLEGDLGSGKTALCRALIRRLAGPETAVPSPTFTLVQTYETAAGPLAHLDLYRLEEPDEVLEIGWEELVQDSICLVEWPGRLGPYTPRNHLLVRLEMTAAGGRRARLEGHGSWQTRLAVAAGAFTDIAGLTTAVPGEFS